MIGDWVFDNMGKVLLAMIALVILLSVLAVNSDLNDKANFMQQCQQDRKEYECYAMWRSSNPQIMPIPIIIPVR